MTTVMIIQIGKRIIYFLIIRKLVLVSFNQAFRNALGRDCKFWFKDDSNLEKWRTTEKDSKNGIKKMPRE